MSDHSTPHFHNTAGHRVIHVGTKEFMCIGALPPLDHPHIYIDMGDATEIICEYCSTLYKYNPALHGDETNPSGCAWNAQIA